MQDHTLKEELDAVMATLRSGHEILPCMQRWLPVVEATLRPLPVDMATVLAGSPDWRLPAPGSSPVWSQIESVDDAAELIIYRAAADKALYVVAPIKE
jgi:hypothetical protein